jgi:hypothetical protein
MDSAFELLRLSASRVNADVTVVEIEGRFAGGGRFARRPRLVVETEDGRLEHAPVHAETVAGRWRGTYAVPADAFDAGTLGLGVRGTLLALPEPDVDERDRFAALARETNALRRALEAAETYAASVEMELRERVDAAEHAAVIARRESQADIARAREEAEVDAEARLRAVDEDAQERVAAAEAAAAMRIEEAEAAAALRIEEAEAAAALQIEEAQRRADDERERADDAVRRAVDAEQRAAEAEQRADALEVDAGAARDAHAEERRRAELAIAALQSSLDEARAQAGAAAPRPPEHDETLSMDVSRAAAVDPGADDPTTDHVTADRVTTDDPTTDDRTAAVAMTADPTTAVPVPGRAPRRRDDERDPREGWVPMHRQPSPARWVAVAALLAFVLVLLVLLGFV